MAKFHLTKAGRAIAALLIVAVVGVAAWFIINKTDFKFGKSGDADITIIVDTYTGWAPIIWGNGGLEGSEESEFYKRFGIKLKIVNMDDFEANRAAWKNGDVDMAFVTLDSYPVEMSSSGTMTEARYFMIHNFSAGADAIVVNKTINTVADLKGKRIAFSEGTASHTLLLNTLEAAGLTNDDITQVKTGYGSDVAQAFKAKQVDAAVVFTPDDNDCIAAVSGSKVLTSTRQANTLITDGFIAKAEWLEKNPKLVKKFIEALLWANSEFNTNESVRKEACKVFSETLNVPLDMVEDVQTKINFATLQDNVNWFGLDPLYSGVTGEKLYTKMSRKYTEIGLAKSVLGWNKVSDSHFIEELMAENDLDNNQDAVATKSRKFTAPTAAMESAPEISNRKVIINFPTNGYTLDAEAQAIIDEQFAPTAVQFNQVRIRVEGNTDNTGNKAHNIELSKKRAQSVVDYLVREYDIDRNRFVVVGNGPDHAIRDGVSGANENYRTTEFKMIAE